MRLRGKEQIYKDQKQERRPNHSCRREKQNHKRTPHAALWPQTWKPDNSIDKHKLLKLIQEVEEHLQKQITIEKLQRWSKIYYQKWHSVFSAR